jgi:hypothetical protein
MCIRDRRLAASFVVCVLWNGVVLIFLILGISRYVQGNPDWLGTAFLVPFVLVGGGTIYWFFRELVLATIIGPTLVEISDHPLRAGGTYELFVSQAGRLKMKLLEILLVCEEEAIYRQGGKNRSGCMKIGFFGRRILRFRQPRGFRPDVGCRCRRRPCIPSNRLITRCNGRFWCVARRRAGRLTNADFL